MRRVRVVASNQRRTGKGFSLGVLSATRHPSAWRKRSPTPSHGPSGRRSQAVTSSALAEVTSLAYDIAGNWSCQRGPLNLKVTLLLCFACLRQAGGGNRVWNPTEHSIDENVRWSWLRAVEWIDWPIFLSQPFVPVFLYFYSWPVVIGAVVVGAFAWRAVSVPFWVSPSLAHVAALFVPVKYISAPVMAYLIGQRGDTLIALMALLWPFIGPAVVMSLLILPTALMERTPLGKASQIGPVQARFLAAMGFSPVDLAVMGFSPVEDVGPGEG